MHRELQRFDAPALDALEAMMAEHGLRDIGRSRQHVHVDLDTTVEPLFGFQEGALPGPNPRFAAAIATTPCWLSSPRPALAELRPGNRSFGDADVPTVMQWLSRLRDSLSPEALIMLRMDTAGD